jgi:hypothetical protein
MPIDEKTLLDLAGRVEQLEGPDRELDEVIRHALEGWHKGARLTNNPPVTASLDAAMSLVPEGWQWKAMSDNGGKPYARLWRPEPFATTFSDEAATPTLALTAACLRAHAAQRGID